MQTCWDFGGVEFLPWQFVYKFSGDKVKRNGVRAGDKTLYLGGVASEAVNGVGQICPNFFLHLYNYANNVAA